MFLSCAPGACTFFNDLLLLYIRGVHGQAEIAVRCTMCLDGAQNKTLISSTALLSFKDSARNSRIFFRGNARFSQL